MQTKLTLRLEKRLIERAKRMAKKEGKSLSQMVADYFRALSRDSVLPEDELPPITRSLFGLLKGTEVDEEDYRRYLDEKYL
jgi:hypothetical protein